MQRFNMFTLIHKALRAMLYDTSLTIQQTSFNDPLEAETALEKIEDVLYIFEKHAHHEDHMVFPAIEDKEPGLADSFEKEHITDLRLSNRMKNLLNIYRNLMFADERIEAGSAITKAFIEFMIFNLEHMGKEEMLINQALWKHYTDAQLMEINDRLVATIPPDELRCTSRWMLRSINNTDVIRWFSGIRDNAPAPVYEAMLALAENELPADRFRKIAKELGELKTAA